MRATTVAGLLRERAASADGDRVAIRFYERGNWLEWTWRDYWTNAMSAAASLRQAGVGPGDHIAMVIPSVRPAVSALFGSWILGAVPIQIGIPFHLHDESAFVSRLTDAAVGLDARFLLTTPSYAGLAAGDRIGVLTTDAFGDVGLKPNAGGEPDGVTNGLPDPNHASGTAFLQLTSGSTSRPRGVIVPHDRLMRHLKAMSDSLPCSAESVGVSWLPLHHDMGLLGGLLFPFFNGFPVQMISTADFRAHPALWLEAMSRFGATIAAAPPSAYAIAVQLADRLVPRGLDLSRWSCAMVGAEPIPPTLFARFSDAFAPAGFRANAFFPVYGLAEAAVAVTFPRLLQTPRFDRVDRAALECERGAIPSADVDRSVVFVGVGTPISGTSIRIADASDDPLPERSVGEIHVRSASSAVGYYGDAEATRAVFRDGWVCTGDLGYVADGVLYITGRQKEIIIKGGHNLIPSVLEEVAAAVPGVRGGAVAAVGVPSPELETELVYVVAETRCNTADHPALAARIQQALKAHGVAIDRVLLVPPKSLPKTTSGKLQRVAIARMVAATLAGEPSAYACARCS
jgi:fatty-acyl-CoA synthase